LGVIALIVALCNSALAGSNASSIASTRVLFALGRIRMLPRLLTRINPHFGTPTVAVAAQVSLALVYGLVLGFVLGGPLNALVLQGTISTILVIAIYISTGVSCCIYYLRERRQELKPVLHIVIPVLSSLVFVPVLLAAFGIGFPGISGITALAYPANFAADVVYAWMALGVLVLGWFLVRDRARLDETGRIFVEESGTG
jgi:amino acid transporter